MSTIVSWWSPKTLSEIENIASDRLNVEDRRYNPKQRPDVLVDTEKVLYRKVLANKGTGMPYTKNVMQLLGINIFNKHILKMSNFFLNKHTLYYPTSLKNPSF